MPLQKKNVCTQQIVVVWRASFSGLIAAQELQCGCYNL